MSGSTELGVIGLLLGSQTHKASVENKGITPDHFQDDRNRILFSAVMSHDADYDPMLIFSKLKDKGMDDKAGGIQHIMECIDVAPLAMYADAYFENLADSHNLRLKEENEKHSKVVDKNPPTSLLALPRPEYGNDPSEIIQNRFLYRGGICILSAPTGVGKSSFIMQWAMHLATCRDYFGLRIGGYYKDKNLRVLVIQAENDEYDLCECRDGVVMACGEQMAMQADPHLSFVTMPDACAEEFATRLDAHCHVFKPDVVFIDPVFSFLGGDNSAQKDVTHWVRNLINPVLMRHKVACIITHHVNKPQKDKIETGAYNMSGSAEWANAARCCLAFEKASEGLYFLVATKRGQRLGWKNDAGERVLKRLIAYHGGEDEHGRPIIAWRDATQEECAGVDDGEQGASKRVKTTVSDLMDVMPTKELIGHGELVRKVMKASGASERAVRSHIKEAVELGLIAEYKAGKTKSYVKNDIDKNVG